MNFNTQIKIKSEKIDPEYDEQVEKVLPMPIIVPKVEPRNDILTAIIDSLASNQIEKIKSEPQDEEENVKEIEESASEVRLPLPLVNVKKERSGKNIDSTFIANFLDELDDPILDELQDIANKTTNEVLEHSKSNVEEGEIVDDRSKSISDDDDTDMETIQKKILEHKKKVKKHKKRKIKEELTKPETNKDKHVKVKKEKNSEKRIRKNSNSDNSIDENSYRRSSNKKKKIEKQSPSPNSFTKIPLVRDYNHKPISPKDNSILNSNNVKKLPTPIIVKVEPSKVLPKPILQLENNIKVEKPDLPKNSRNTVQKVLKRCTKIISNLETYEKNNFSTQMLYTPINFITPSHSNTENRSPLLAFKNVHYNISSTAKINYKELGLSAPPEIVAKLARIIGFDTNKLMDLMKLRAASSNFKLEKDVSKSILTSNSFSSFYTNVSTQTDQIPCDQCVLRKLRKRHDISVQAVAVKNEIAVQTEKEDELPMIQQFHTLNMNQQLALNDFYSAIIGGQPSNANDKLKLRDRLMQIFDMATTQQIINPITLIAPPAPVLPANPYSSGITQSILGYQAPILSTSPLHYDPYYQQSQQLMVPNNYQQSHQSRHSKQMPRNSDPRRHNYKR